MISALSISPSGFLHHAESGIAQYSVANTSIIKAFFTSSSEGLISLVQSSNTIGWPAYLHYWRKFATRYFNQLCQQGDVDLPDVVAPPDIVILSQLLLELPPMIGAEYCSVEMLKNTWNELDQSVRGRIIENKGGLSAFIANHLPKWHQIGRICFHLAENKKDPDFPFGFIATYACEMGRSDRMTHKPLHQALKEYAGEGNKKQLINLLKPIHNASKSCEWVARLLKSSDIYYPLAWSPQDAYQLLKNVSVLEESGIIVRLPDWWKKRPRPRVKASIGNSKQKAFDVQNLLDFKLSIVLGDQLLTPAELQHILSSQQGLVSLRGQWVEADPEKLQQVLHHWEKIQASTGEDGLTFIEGMRLLSGANPELTNNDLTLDENDSWAFVAAGDWLKGILLQLNDPSVIKLKQPGSLLKAKLRPYQVIGANWLDLVTELGLGACLADDMGLGKTIQVISLLLMKKKKNPTMQYPSLLVLPASLLSNWKSELKRFSPSLTTVFFHASELSKQKMEDMIQTKDSFTSIDLVLTTYGTLLKQPALQKQVWHLIILDEAQAIKSPHAKQTKLVKQLRGRAKIALTGTPIENRLGDLWSLFDFLCPGLLGSAHRFKKYLVTIEKDDQPSYAPLRKLVHPYMLRRLKTDKHIIDDLPDKTEMIAWCGISKTQVALYAQSVKELSDAIHAESGIKRKGLVLSYLMRFKQICNHPSQALGDGEYRKNDSGKFSRLTEICQEIADRQEKVLIFTQFREMTEPLRQLLEPIFSHPGLVLHGGTPVKKRKPLVDQFQDEFGAPFFVLSLKAAGTGLNLTAANHVIHFDRWWNPAVENQATDRAFRIGQKKNVVVHKFVCRGTVEEKINEMISDKVKLATDVLKTSGEPLLTELKNDDLIQLVSLDLDKLAT